MTERRTFLSDAVDEVIEDYENRAWNLASEKRQPMLTADGRRAARRNVHALAAKYFPSLIAEIRELRAERSDAPSPAVPSSPPRDLSDGEMRSLERVSELQGDLARLRAQHNALRDALSIAEEAVAGCPGGSAGSCYWALSPIRAVLAEVKTTDARSPTSGLSENMEGVKPRLDESPRPVKADIDKCPGCGLPACNDEGCAEWIWKSRPVSDAPMEHISATTGHCGQDMSHCGLCDMPRTGDCPCMDGSNLYCQGCGAAPHDGGGYCKPTCPVQQFRGAEGDATPSTSTSTQEHPE